MTAIPRQSAQVVVLPNVRLGHDDTSPSECRPAYAWHRSPPLRGARPRLVCRYGQILTDDDFHASIDQGAKQ